MVREHRWPHENGAKIQTETARGSPGSADTRLSGRNAGLQLHATILDRDAVFDLAATFIF